MKAIKLSIIVQTTHEMKIRQTLSKLGTGTIGNYMNYQFITRGEAQFESNKEASCDWATWTSKHCGSCTNSDLVQRR